MTSRSELPNQALLDRPDRTGALPVALAVALALTACAGTGSEDPALRTVPIDSLPMRFDAVIDTTAWTVPPAEAPGDTLLTLEGGDHRLPALGPAGDRVAFADVLRSDTFVRSRVLVAGLEDDTARVLLDREAVAGYGAGPYDAWVIGLSWRGLDTLEARIADGDVGTTTVRLDPATGTVLSERYEQGDPTRDLPAEEAALRGRILEAFSSWRREVVTSSFRMGQVVEAPDGVVIQKRYAGEDAHVRWLGWAERDTTRLLEVPRAMDRRADLRPGAAIGNRVLFPVVMDERVHLFDFRPDEALRYWGSVAAGPSHFTRLRQVAAAGDTALLQLDAASGDRCCVHEPVLRVTPEGPVEWTLEGPVSGVDASLERGLVAWTRWTTPDSARALTVVRLR